MLSRYVPSQTTHGPARLHCVKPVWHIVLSLSLHALELRILLLCSRTHLVPHSGEATAQRTAWGGLSLQRCRRLGRLSV